MVLALVRWDTTVQRKVTEAIQNFRSAQRRVSILYWCITMYHIIWEGVIGAIHPADMKGQDLMLTSDLHIFNRFPNLQLALSSSHLKILDIWHVLRQVAL